MSPWQLDLLPAGLLAAWTCVCVCMCVRVRACEAEIIVSDVTSLGLGQENSIGGGETTADIIHAWK